MHRTKLLTKKCVRLMNSISSGAKRIYHFFVQLPDLQKSVCVLYNLGRYSSFLPEKGFISIAKPWFFIKKSSFFEHYRDDVESKSELRASNILSYPVNRISAAKIMPVLVAFSSPSLSGDTLM